MPRTSKNKDDNLEALMSAANQKLKAQKQGQGQPTSNPDIYADIRREAETGEQEYPLPTINHSPDTSDVPPVIEHGPEAEEPVYIEKDLEPLFPDGPPIGQVELWKKQYDKEKIFHTQIIDKHFIFRTLNRFEYKQIVALENIDALYREEIICNTCVLWPLHYDFKTMAAEDSGYPSTLAQIIMENSGFTKEYGIEVL